MHNHLKIVHKFLRIIKQYEALNIWRESITKLVNTHGMDGINNLLDSVALEDVLFINRTFPLRDRKNTTITNWRTIDLAFYYYVTKFIKRKKMQPNQHTPREWIAAMKAYEQNGYIE